MSELLVGNIALIVVDLQEEGFVADGPIPIMPGYEEVVENSLRLVRAARHAHIPLIAIQEQHSRTWVDFGRELDGHEGPHDLEDDPLTEIVEEARPRDDEYLVVKRRYSAFFGTDLEILLKGLGAETLVLCGGLTNVCVQYTYVDAHQHNYRVRVAQDAVIGSNPEAHQAALAAMAYFQLGALRSTDELVEGFQRYQGARRPAVKPFTGIAKAPVVGEE